MLLERCDKNLDSEAAQLQCEGARDEQRLVRLRSKQQAMGLPPGRITRGQAGPGPVQDQQDPSIVLFTGSTGVAGEPLMRNAALAV